MPLQDLRPDPRYSQAYQQTATDGPGAYRSQTRTYQPQLQKLSHKQSIAKLPRGKSGQGHESGSLRHHQNRIRVMSADDQVQAKHAVMTQAGVERTDYN